MAVGNYQPLDFLKALSANLLKKGRAAINKITGLPNDYLIADALTHPGERTKVTQYFNCYAVTHRTIFNITASTNKA